MDNLKYVLPLKEKESSFFSCGPHGVVVLWGVAMLFLVKMGHVVKFLDCVAALPCCGVSSVVSHCSALFGIVQCHNFFVKSLMEMSASGGSVG